ncbi:unnamed protein product [Polarella glacialis]|uniref:LTD domain-containing protein n=1 Tax=Polarella glacialis TaxID=89957 RepID=A0A813L064_POLGL|nr:unnamed protein product [Polarella glacialis]
MPSTICTMGRRLFIAATLGVAGAAVQISEVASKGSTGICLTEDWIELHNGAETDVSLDGYIIHDDKGIADKDAANLDGKVVVAGGYLLLCGKVDFQFGVGGTDTVTMVAPGGTSVTSGVLGSAGDVDTTWAVGLDGVFVASATPTPGYGNSVYILAVSDKGATDVCAGADYVILANPSAANVDVGGYILYDSKGIADSDAYKLPAPYVLAAGVSKTLCKTEAFSFGIGGGDIITLITAVGGEIVARVALPDTHAGVFDEVYALRFNATLAAFTYKWVSAGLDKKKGPHSLVYISEVAAKGSESGECAGEDWVELHNPEASAVNMSGYVLHDDKGAADTDAFHFAADVMIGAGAFMTLCKGTFAFGIGGNDAVGLARNGTNLSTTGPMPDAVYAAVPGTTWARRGDESFTYTTKASPGAANVFARPAGDFVSAATQSCGTYKAPPLISSYVFDAAKGVTKIAADEVNAMDDVSGGAFDGRTCSNWFVRNDPEQLLEFDETVTTAKPTRRIKLSGISDSEGLCFFGDVLIIATEPAPRSLLACKVPAATATSGPGGADVFIYGEDCMRYSVSTEQLALFGGANSGFEGVACDTASNRIFAGQETDPYRVWVLDVATGIFSVFLDKFDLNVTGGASFDVAGMAFDPIGQSLFVLSQEQKKIVQLNASTGAVLAMLDVPQGNQPEGIHFLPNSQTLVVSSEDDEILFYTPVYATVPAPTTLSPTTATVSMKPTTPSPTTAAVSMKPTTPSPTNANTAARSSALGAVLAMVLAAAL